MTPADAPIEVAIGPQPGSQTSFLASPADITIGGGSAGGGKTWGLLLEPLRHIENPDFSATILRREMPQVTQDGGMWQESAALYRFFGARPVESPRYQWRFPSKARVSFSHCQHEQDRYNYDGAQIPLLGIDQLEAFTSTIFWHLFGRCRWRGEATRVVRPYCRATANPVPEEDQVGGWLHRLLQWWIDPDTGYAIPERSGRLRWFVRTDDDDFDWADDPETLRRRHQGATTDVSGERQARQPVSLTFVRMERRDNPALTAKDPDYDAKLAVLPLVDRERLVAGNWNARPAAGKVFDRVWFTILKAWPVTSSGHPVGVARRVRAWDKAGTEGGGKWSAGVLLARTTEGVFVVEDVTRGQWSFASREHAIAQCAMGDPPGTVVWLEQEPGSGGKESAELTVRRLASMGIEVHAERPTGSKLDRAGPLRSAAEAGIIRLMPGPWVEPFLRECHAWDGSERMVCDQIDAGAHAFRKLALHANEVQLLEIRGF